MAAKSYMINKGVNRSIVFKGLVAQYIWYMGAGMFAVLLVYALMYVLGVNTFISLGVSVCLGVAMGGWIFHLSSAYGEHGLTKVLAARSIPKIVKSHSRRLFFGKGTRHPESGKDTIKSYGEITR